MPWNQECGMRSTLVSTRSEVNCQIRKRKGGGGFPTPPFDR